MLRYLDLLGLALLTVVVLLVAIGLDTLQVLVLAVEALQVRQLLEYLLPIVFHLAHFIA